MVGTHGDGIPALLGERHVRVALEFLTIEERRQPVRDEGSVSFLVMGRRTTHEVVRTNDCTEADLAAERRIERAPLIAGLRISFSGSSCWRDRRRSARWVRSMTYSSPAVSGEATNAP